MKLNVTLSLFFNNKKFLFKFLLIKVQDKVCPELLLEDDKGKIMAKNKGNSHGKN